MSIEALLNGLMFFSICLVFFLFSVRLYKPKKEIMYILIVFIVFPSIVFVALFFIRDYSQEILKFVVIAEIHYAMSLAFIQTYPVLKIEIPTFKILILLKDAKNIGLTKSELKELMPEKELFMDRLIDLKNDGLISQSNGNISLNPPGRFLAQIFYNYRRLLGFSTGQG